MSLLQVNRIEPQTIDETVLLSRASFPVWASSTLYIANQIIRYGNSLYLCLVSHIAGVFATDVNGGKWNEISTLNSSGWVIEPHVCSYVSADAPTFVMSIAADVTALYTPGMRIKLTQSSMVAYYIVTAVGSYSAGVTPLTLHGGTDYTLADTAISDVYISRVKAPQGFSLDSTKWGLQVTDTVDRSTTSATYTNSGLGSLNISIPIGCWRTFFSVPMYSASANAYSSLSTSATSESDSDFTLWTPGACGALLVSRKVITLASKTTYYAIGHNNGSDTLYWFNSKQKLTIGYECAYL